MRAARWAGGCCSLMPKHMRLYYATPIARAPYQIDAVDGLGYTALYRTSQPLEDGASVQNLPLLLLQRGARTDICDADGDTPLHNSAQDAFFGTMRLLVDHGAKVDASNHAGMTPLMVLLQCRDDDCVAEGVRVLAGRGADVNAADADGRTPLYHAVRLNNGDTIRALLTAGAHAKQDSGPWLIDELLDATDPRLPDAETIEALLDAGAGASLAAVSRLAEAAAAYLGDDPGDAEDYVGLLPRVLAAAQRALDEDVGARVAAGLAAAVEADRRDVASGVRSLITGAAAEARRLEAARVAAAQERRAAAAQCVELLRLRAEVATLAGGGGAAIAAEGAGGGGGGEAGPLAKRARGG
jgi:hypothetical protein